MGYNRFYLSLFLHVILITLLSFGFVYFIFETGQVTTALFFLVLIALVTGRLIFYLNRINRLLGIYFTYLNENDPVSKRRYRQGTSKPSWTILMQESLPSTVRERYN
jgi:hypothetical protein